MPTYEYQCGTCGNRFEKYQSFSDEPIKICPECGNEVRKVFSAAGIIFKGSGWYVNDSRKSSGSDSKSSAKTSADGDSTSSKSESSETKTEVKAEGSSDSKSEPKTETKSDSKSDGKKEAAA